MNYLITYLAGGRRRRERVAALDAATAVATVIAHRRQHPTCSFELLSVLPAAPAAGKQTGKPALTPV